ncbi:MAG: DUF4956 domain-containing protein [Calditrichaceae bacterium]|jgi:uncharacterized membrane protein YhiD involved in acid resistance
MFQEFERSIFTSISIDQLIANLIMALICGLIISVIYRWTYRGPHYSTSYVHAIVILSMVTALVIMVIGNNLARAFGLVGAMSIIRFRTAVKDTQDIVIIFFALAAGMAAGVGLKALALAGTVVIGGVIVLLYKFNYAKPHKRDILLQFTGQMANGEHPYLDIIDKYCRSSKMINTQALGDQGLYEISFHVKLKDEDKRMDFIREMNQTSELSNVRLFYDDDQS